MGDNMSSRLLNLALPPAPLDETELSQRLKKYGQAMRLHVLSQPVDPIHLRTAGFDSEPMPLCSTNAEHLEALKTPSATNDGKVLNQLLDSLQEAMQPEHLIVAFPTVTLPQLT